MEKKSTLISAILDFDLERRGAKYLTKSVCSVAVFAPLSPTLEFIHNKMNATKAKLKRKARTLATTAFIMLICIVILVLFLLHKIIGKR